MLLFVLSSLFSETVIGIYTALVKKSKFHTFFQVLWSITVHGREGCMLELQLQVSSFIFFLSNSKVNFTGFIKLITVPM